LRPGVVPKCEQARLDVLAAQRLLQRVVEQVDLPDRGSWRRAAGVDEAQLVCGERAFAMRVSTVTPMTLLAAEPIRHR
jgi:hypothetical protein